MEMYVGQDRVRGTESLCSLDEEWASSAATANEGQDTEPQNTNNATDITDRCPLDDEWAPPPPVELEVGANFLHADWWKAFESNDLRI